jgi:integrase
VEELKAYWQALDHEGDGPASGLRLCLLTGQRQQNILGMRRDQLFLQDRIWRVPPATTKTDKPYKVPLSEMAIEIIESRLADMKPDQQRVFPKRGGEGPAGLNFLSKPHRRACKAAGIPDYKPHDNRHTFATHCDIMGIPRLVWDGILGHSIASMAELYSGHDFADERLKCVERWADRIAAALSDNVIPLKLDTSA